MKMTFISNFLDLARCRIFLSIAFATPSNYFSLYRILAYNRQRSLQLFEKFILRQLPICDDIEHCFTTI